MANVREDNTVDESTEFALEKASGRCKKEEEDKKKEKESE